MTRGAVRRSAAAISGDSSAAVNAPSSRNTAEASPPASPPKDPWLIRCNKSNEPSSNACRRARRSAGSRSTRAPKASNDRRSASSSSPAAISTCMSRPYWPTALSCGSVGVGAMPVLVSIRTISRVEPGSSSEIEDSGNGLGTGPLEHDATPSTRAIVSRGTGGRPRSQWAIAYDSPQNPSSRTIAPVTGSARNGLINSQGMWGSSERISSVLTPRWRNVQHRSWTAGGNSC